MLGRPLLLAGAVLGAYHPYIMHNGANTCLHGTLLARAHVYCCTHAVSNQGRCAACPWSLDACCRRPLMACVCLCRCLLPRGRASRGLAPVAGAAAVLCRHVSAVGLLAVAAALTGKSTRWPARTSPGECVRCVLGLTLPNLLWFSKQ
jgi:hypothetical protein